MQVQLFFKYLFERSSATLWPYNEERKIIKVTTQRTMVCMQCKGKTQGKFSPVCTPFVNTANMCQLSKGTERPALEWWPALIGYSSSI